MLNKIMLGLLGLVLTFVSGEQLQYWWDHGTILYRATRRSMPTHISYEINPYLYCLQVCTYSAGLLAGLCMVWVGMGGKLWKR
jgi:hypothetical protein